MKANESGKERKGSDGSAKVSLGDILQGIGLLAVGWGIFESMFGHGKIDKSVILGYIMVGGLIVAGIGKWLNRSRNK